MELLFLIDWATVVEALGVIALAVAAATPTDKDNGIVGRVVNITRVALPFLRRK